MNQAIKQSEQFLRIAQVMDLVGIKKSTVWKWIHTRNFPKQHKLSVRVSVWKRTEVQEWMDAQLNGVA